MNHVVLCDLAAMCQIWDLHVDSQDVNLIWDNIDMYTVFVM